MRKPKVSGAVAAILHSALIRQTWLFCVWALWGLFYKMGLCTIAWDKPPRNVDQTKGELFFALAPLRFC